MSFRVVLLVIILFSSSSAPLQAQLFGPGAHRKLSLADRRSSTGTSTLFGADLGIRASRGTGAFVGADPTDQTGFVGVADAIPPVPVVAATEGLREEIIENVNEVVATRTAAGIYAPRLTIAFDLEVPPRTSDPQDRIDRGLPRRAITFQPSQDLTVPLQVDPVTRLQEALVKTMGTDLVDSIQVTVENRTATLRGSVASEDVRSRAALVASFEPGIDQIENRLTVRNPSHMSQE